MDMLPQILLSCVMGAAVYCVSLLGLKDIYTLLIQIPLGAGLYILGSKILHIDSYRYIIGIAKGYLKSAKRKSRT